MKRLLIADGTQNLSDAIAEMLSGDFDISCCNQGEVVLQQLIEFRPDILLLDLMLPGEDGISILKTARSAGLNPAVVATTYYVSDYVLQAMEELQVNYLMMKPCDVQALAKRILDVAYSSAGKEEETEKIYVAINLLFLTLGLRRSLSGYKYLREAVARFYRNSAQSVTKTLYPAVADAFDGTWQQIERAIRICIQDAFEKRNDALWRMYFPAGRDGRARRVTNAHFIAKMADCLHQMLNE